MLKASRSISFASCVCKSPSFFLMTLMAVRTIVSGFNEPHDSTL